MWARLLRGKVSCNSVPSCCGRDGDAKFIGKAEDAHWARTQELLAEVKRLPAGQDPKSYYTNEYLLPVSELRACKR
jgi:hypothetical protein